MSITWEKRWGLACAALVWAMMGVAAGAEIPQTLTLKDTKGRAIEIRPTSATDTEVAGIRSSDQKEVKIPLDTLDAESRKSVQGWKKLTGRLPTKEFVIKLSSQERLSKDYTVKFKVPEGLYNVKIENLSLSQNRVILHFDVPSGEEVSRNPYFSFFASVSDRKQDEALLAILEGHNKSIAMLLERMTPSERALNEPLLKAEPISHGEFKGYKRGAYKSNGYSATTTNGKFQISVSLNYGDLENGSGLPITADDVPRILETIEIVKGH
jgi:hypothetical protein